MARSAPTRWPLLLALGAVTCQRPGSIISDAPDDGVADQARADHATEGGEPTVAADPTHPLELVPARARMMLMVRSPQRLSEVWQRDRFAAEQRVHYDRITSEIVRDVGRDLLDPRQLAAIGIDPTAPLGIAVLSVRDEAFVVFGGSPNPQALVDLVESLAGKPLPRRQVGAAQLLTIDDEVSLVLRHGMFAFVLVDRHRPQSPDYALEVARIHPAQSLAHAPAMERAHTGLPSQADLQGLLDVAGIVHDELTAQRQRDESAMAELSQRLAEARQRGAAPGELDALQQQITEQQAFMARRRRERQIGEMLLSRTLGSIDGIGMAVDGDERGLRGRIHVALQPESMFRSLLVTPPGTPAAITALEHEPLLVLSGGVDVPTALDLIAQIALADGDSYAEYNDEIEQELRIDFDREIRPLLDGRGTFALTAGPLPAATDVRDPDDVIERIFGGVLAVGVNDEAAARALLDRAVALWPELSWRPEPEIHGHRLTNADGPSPLWLGVVAERFVVGTDLAAIRRLRDGAAGPAASRLPDAEAWSRLTEGTAEARLALAHRLIAGLAFRIFGSGPYEGRFFEDNIDFMLRHEFEDEDLSAIPPSAAVKRLQRRYTKLRDEQETLLQRRVAERAVAWWKHTEGLGITAGTVREVDSGLMMEGGHYVAGGVGGYLQTIMDLADADRITTSVDAELERARAAASEAEAALMRARREQIQRTIERRG